MAEDEQDVYSGSLDDYFYSYGTDANGDEKELSDIVLEGAEFAAITTPAGEIRLPPGHFYPYQDQLARTAQFVGKAVCLYAPGTGKTSTYTDVCVSLIMKQITGNKYVDQYISTGKTFVIKAVILTSGTGLADNVREQIVKYYHSRDMNPSKIDQFFEISPYEKFANRLMGIFDERYYKSDSIEECAASFRAFCTHLKNNYSNCVFIFDESTELGGEDLLKLNYDLLEYGSEIDVESFASPSAFRDSLKGFPYHLVHLASHCGDDTIRMAFTGTPMKNNVREFASTFNLVNDYEDQIPFNSDFAHWDEEDFDKHFSDIVYYIEHPKGNVTRTYVGERHSDVLGYNFYECPIKEDSTQEAAYFQASMDKKAIDVGLPYASKMVGMDGEQLSVQSTKDGKFVEYIKKKENLLDVSSKGYALREICEKYPREKVAIQENYVENNGVYADVLTLRSMGYEEYNPATENLEIGAAGRLIPGSKKKRRYIIGVNIANNWEKVMEVWECLENIRGDYIRFFIGSPKTRIGFSIRETAIVILGFTQWNKASTEQIVGRYDRVKGMEIYRAHQRFLHEKGLFKGNPEIVDIKIHILMSTFERTDPNSWEEEYGKVPEISGELQTSDENQVAISEEKQKLIDVFWREMIKRSVTLRLNAERNTDIGITPPELLNPDELSYNAFENLYIKDYSDYISSQIVAILQVQSTITVEKLIAKYSYLGYPLAVYEEAIENLVASKATVKNSYGITSYIRYKGGIVYLVNEYPVSSPSIFDSFYGNKIPIFQGKEIKKEVAKTDDFVLGLIKETTIAGVRRQISRIPEKEGTDKLMLVRNIIEEAISKFYVEGDKSYKVIVDTFAIYTYKINGDYYHAFITGEKYTTMSYFLSPSSFRHLSDGEWSTVDKTSPNYNFISSEICSMLKKKIASTVSSMKLPLIAESLDGLPRILRRSDDCYMIPVCGACTSDPNARIDARSIKRGTLFSDVKQPDLITAMYQINPDELPDDTRTPEEIVRRTYEQLKDEHFRNENIIPSGTSSANLGNMMIALSVLLNREYFHPYKRGQNSSIKAISASDLLQFVKKDKMVPGYEKDAEWMAACVGNWYLSHGTRGVTSSPVPLKDIEKKKKYLLYVYNWSEHYRVRKVKNNIIYQELIQMARDKNRYLLI